MLPPAEAALALKPTIVVGENGKIFAPSRFMRAAWMAARCAASSGRFKKPSTGDQLFNGDRVGYERMRNDKGIGRMQTNRWIKIQDLAESCRRGENFRFGGLDISLASGQLSCRAIGVGLAPLAGIRIIPCELCNHACFFASLNLGRTPTLSAQ